MENPGGGHHRPPPPRGGDEWREWLGFQPVRAISLNPASAGGVSLLKGEGVLSGWSLHEAASQAGVFQIFDGDDTGGRLLGEFNVGSGGNNQVSLPLPGVFFRAGLYLNRVSGTATLRGGVFVHMDI